PPFMSFMRLRYNYIIIDDAMQGGMLILLKIPIAHHTERYRQSGKVGRSPLLTRQGTGTLEICYNML
ncbi:MAG: hypothetical protein IJG84_01280, partial [Kiritimatiellae bacterium]|nr:hypothetical protein [Kiritimatiellia bacterium]